MLPWVMKEVRSIPLGMTAAEVKGSCQCIQTCCALASFEGFVSKKINISNAELIHIMVSVIFDKASHEIGWWWHPLNTSHIATEEAIF